MTAKKLLAEISLLDEKNESTNKYRLLLELAIRTISHLEECKKTLEDTIAIYKAATRK